MVMMNNILLLLALVALGMAKNLHPDPHAHYQTPSISGIGRNLISFTEHKPITNSLEKKDSYWISLAHEQIAKRIADSTLNLNKAKNVIMFLGDGMSLNTLTAARILKGQREGRTGEEEVLFFERFPHTALSKTYCVDSQVADSACTATAYLCGVKTNIGTIGITADVGYRNCTASMDPANQVSSIAAWAQAAGKATGIITTTTLTHASPAGTYAHTAYRFWESDSDIIANSDSNSDLTECMDIAKQLITQEPGRSFDVMLGGGMGKFLPNTIQDLHGNMGERQDGVNLLSEWQVAHPGGVLVANRDQLLSVNIEKTNSLIGLFQSSVMDYHRLANATTQPTLAEMTEVALKMLSKNENGYFIFIEGGLIDYGNHYNTPGISLDETLEFEKAVQVAREITNPNDTLIVVTSDHAHPLTISGYPNRGNDILNLNEADVDSNGIKYTTLQYSVGTEQYLDTNGNRIDLTNAIDSDLFVFPSYVKADIGVHAGDDVGVFASGPYSHLFGGSLEQNSIPHMMAYAACIGDGPTMCNTKK